ncbi:hypothetical protein M885DRAFT_497552 [Pelagophyceae sp. CCMP2097]|nr:hypothetical protein M885DRAFT_497552 [Pelagophyceae sp. CCMP2097]
MCLAPRLHAQVLRVLDPRNALLDAVARPVRAYLRKRPDTESCEDKSPQERTDVAEVVFIDTLQVRCIVQSLTDDNSSDLAQELHRAGPVDAEEDSDDEHAGPGLHWQPASREAPRRGKAHLVGDILPMLISIYGSKGLFVREYRNMLAEKLISSAVEVDTEREIKNLELLKLRAPASNRPNAALGGPRGAREARFGESALHECGVMVRDVEASAKLVPREDGDVLQATVVSQVFWPAGPFQAAQGAGDKPLKVHAKPLALLEASEAA